MFINYIEMKNNTRLMIRGTTFMRVTFKEIHQLILGTNGCGKSTLIHELSPLPPQGSDYLKNGYKKINIDHNGQNYTLTSTYSVQAGKHSFYNETTQEELNEGGTQSVQRTLVSEVFNYDQSLHDVLTDQLKFTNMSPLQRRHWLTRISGTNLDFAIELFNKLKRAERDEEAVVKHLTERLNKEAGDLPTVDDIKALEQRFNNLDVQIKELYQYRDNNNYTATKEMVDSIAKMVKDATTISRSLLMLSKSSPSIKVSNYNELLQMQANLNKERQGYEQRIVELYEEHNDITTMLGDTEGLTTEAQQAELLNKINILEDEIENHRGRLKDLTQQENAQVVHGRLLGMSSTVYDILTHMPDNTEGYFSKDKRLALEAQVNDLNLKLSNTARFINTCEHDIIHIEKAADVTCPKCNHTFKAGVNESQLPEIKRRLEEAQTQYLKLEEDKARLSELLSEYVSFRDTYIRYSNVLSSNNDLGFLRNPELLDFNNNSPKYIMEIFRGYVLDVERLANIESLEAEVSKLKDIYTKVKNVNASNNYTTEKLVRIENQIVELKDKAQTAYVNFLELEEKEKEWDKITGLYRNLDHQLGVIVKAIDYTYAGAKKYAIDQMITKVNTDLAHVNLELNQSRNKQNIVDDVTRQRDIVKNKAAIYKILVNEINPTNGLIADYFKQFIHQFVEQMNIIINKVWEHDIELLPCDVNSDGISYKFPLRINNKPYGPADGSKGSNSQVSIVNFAFKIVVMVYLGLDDYPLYLDELAPDLDEKHRINIISFVRSFVESKRCSQMWMVSHYATGYGAFTNAEILILDEENLIDIPITYNQHATIIKDETLIDEV